MKGFVRISLPALVFSATAAGGTTFSGFNDPERYLREADVVARVRVVSSRSQPCSEAWTTCERVYCADVVRNFKGQSTEHLVFSYTSVYPFENGAELLVLAELSLDPPRVVGQDVTRTGVGCSSEARVFRVGANPDSANRIVKSEGQRGEREWAVMRGGLEGENWFPPPDANGSDDVQRRADGSVLWADLEHYIVHVLER